MTDQDEPLVLTGLTRYYDRVVGIEGLDLRVERGEILGLIGLNGAGKSTTLRLAIGQLIPSAGQALLFGQPARDANDARRRLGYVPSEVPFYRTRTGRENLDLLLALGGHDRRAVLSRRRELAARLGMSELDLDRPIKDMSHGMRQKVGLLQAIEHQPDLVILDEPSDGLDPIARQVLAELLVELREGGASVILASHVLSEMERVADRVAILHRGHLVALETDASLKARDTALVEVGFTGAAPDLSLLDGIELLERGDGHLRLHAQPPLQPLLAALGRVDVTRLSVREPSLEDLVRRIAGEQDAS